MERGAAEERALQCLAPLSARLCGHVAVTILPCKSLAPVKSTAFTGRVLSDLKSITALKQHLSPVGKKHPFSSVTLRTSPVAALDVLSQWLTLSGQENKQENRVTRKKVKPWKVKKAACLEDNSRAANDGQEKSCHFQSCQGRGKPCRHRVIILKVLRLGRIMTAVFVMHVNMGKELRRALASPGFGQQRGEGKRGCCTGCVVHPCAAATQPGVEGLCYQPEG